MWDKPKEQTGSMARRKDGAGKKMAPEKKSREGGETEACVFLRTKESNLSIVRR